MSIRFDGKVAIVTGAGNGLGKDYAISLAERGAKVVVNDLGGTREGAGGSISAAQEVVNHITAAGGEAMANGANVTDEADVASMVKATLDQWGRIDILINNAGILRDKSFHGMDFANFRAVLDVHLVGSAICTHAVWPVMREQEYGRVMLTASPSGLYGNFGQANYGAAKAGMIGLMKALHIEGAKSNINVNVLSPAAKTRMTEDLGIPEAMLDLMSPQAVTPAVLFLASDEAPSGAILSCSAGGYATAHVVEGDGVYLSSEDQTPEKIAENWSKISSTDNLHYYKDASADPGANFIGKAMAHINK